MIAYTRVKIAHLLRLDFVRFCIVGGTGFVINFGLLLTLNKLLDIPTFWAQLMSAEVALFSNFMLHHHWTYKRNKVVKSLRQLLVQFHATSWIAIVGSAFMVSAFERFLHLDSLEALAVSSLIALLWNFAWSKYVVWKDVPLTDAEEVVV